MFLHKRWLLHRLWPMTFCYRLRGQCPGQQWEHSVTCGSDEEVITRGKYSVWFNLISICDILIVHYCCLIRLWQGIYLYLDFCKPSLGKKLSPVCFLVHVRLSKCMQWAWIIFFLKVCTAISLHCHNKFDWTWHIVYLRSKI